MPAATDVDGTIASYDLLGDVAEGSLTFNTDGSYSFDPTGDFDDLAPGESRDVSFTYTATDDQGDVSGTATVTITVTGINDSPVATDDTATTDEDTLLNTTVPVATDVDGTIASYNLLGDVAEGSLTFNADGSYSFDPSGDFDDLAPGDSRDVSFTYTATDDQGDVSGTATVTITVTGINDSPVATDDTATTDEDTLLNTNVPAATDVDGTIASYDLLGDVAEGSPTFNADGSYSFDPTGDFDDLAPGESRDVSFTYTATDDQGGVSGTATVTITVTGINDSPVATDDTATTDEDTLLNTTVPVATDVDGTIASYNLLGDVAEGSLTFNADGSYSFDPSGDFDDLAPGESQDVTFTYSATDDQGELSATATVTITVTGLNDPPVATDDTVTTDEDTLLNTTVPVATDVDGTIASYGLVGDVAEGSLTFNADGSYSFDPSGDFDDLALGESRDVTFTYSATDDQGDVSGTATVTITVTGINDPPVATDDTATTDEDTLLNTNVPLATDVDGTIASYDLLGDVAEGSLTFNADGSYSFDPTGDFDDLAPGESRDVTFTYSATDDQGDVSGTATVTITVTGINDSPVATDDTATTDEDTLLNTNVPAATDVDGTIASYDLLGDVAEGSLTFNADGSYSFNPTGDFDDLAPGESRDVTFTYSATDDQGDVSATATVTITVTGVNDAPLGTDRLVATDEDTDYVFLVSDFPYSDVDGDPLAQVRLDSLPTAGTLRLSGNPVTVGTVVTAGQLTTGLLVFQPVADETGLGYASFEFSVGDGQAFATSPATLTIDVNPINDPPVADDDNGTTDEDTLVNVAAGSGGLLDNDTDVDLDSLAITQLNGAAYLPGTSLTLPSGALLTVNADGSYSYDPNGQFETLGTGTSTTDTFTYTIEDGNGGTDTATVAIAIQGVNDPPVSVNDADSTDEDTPLEVVAGSGGLLDNDSDIEGNVLSIVELNGNSYTPGDQITLSSGALLTVFADGSYTYDPNGRFEGLGIGDTAIETFTYAVEDGNGGTDMATVTLTVFGANDPPLARDDHAMTRNDVPITVAVAENDTDADADPLRVTLLDPPAAGSATVNADGSITYVPEITFVGTIQIAYQVEDPSGATSMAILTIEVTPSFTFDSFNNFSEGHGSNDMQSVEHPQRLLTQEISKLAPEPIFSGSRATWNTDCWSSIHFRWHSDWRDQLVRRRWWELDDAVS